MAGPLAIAGGEKALAAVGKAVSNDLLVIQGRIFRKVIIEPARRKTKTRPAQKEIFVLEPIDLEAHINPVAIGLGALGLGAAALAAWVAWNGIKVGVPTIGTVTVIPGIKDTARGQRFAEEHLPPPPPPTGNSCQDLHDRWRNLRSDPIWWLNPFKIVELQAIEHDATVLGCAWLANP